MIVHLATNKVIRTTNKKYLFTNTSPNYPKISFLYFTNRPPTLLIKILAIHRNYIPAHYICADYTRGYKLISTLNPSTVRYKTHCANI